MGANRSWLTIATGLVLAAAHGGMCWRLFGGSAALAAPLPLLTEDHAFNFYYAIRSRDFFRQSGTNAGYDPSFMAGYAKSNVFPTSATLAESIVYLVGGERPQVAYKLYVMFAAALAPPILAAAAWLWSADRRVALGALVLHLVYFWTDWGSIYVVLGMVPFVLSGSLTLLALSLLERYLTRLTQPSMPDAANRSWRNVRSNVAGWLGATIATAFACLTHPVSALVLAPGYLAAYVQRWPRLRLRQHLALWSAVVCVLGINGFWLFPGLVLLSTKGSSVSGFVNPNVLQRLLEPFTQSPAIEAAILLLAPPGLWRWSRTNRAGTLTLAVSLAHVFFLAYPAGLFRSLDSLQPGRNTLYLFCWGAFAAAFFCRDAVDWAAARWARSVRIAVGLTIVAAATPAVVPPVANVVSAMLRTPDPAWHSRMPPHLAELVAWLRRHTRPGERAFFEESNRGVFDGSRKLPDPFGDFRIAPLLPLLTGLEVIGGPYLYAHQKTNFTQFGDGRFLGRAEVDAATFIRFSTWYDVHWIVCWSPGAVAFCQAHPELVSIAKQIGDPRQPFLVGRLKRPQKPAVIGEAIVAARPGRIEVKDAQPDAGILVLRYHWTPNLRSQPPATIDAYPVGADPVGLIRITNPPTDFTITLDPWAMFRGSQRLQP